jgi:hypothetical protein
MTMRHLAHRLRSDAEKGSDDRQIFPAHHDWLDGVTHSRLEIQANRDVPRESHYVSSVMRRRCFVRIRVAFLNLGSDEADAALCKPRARA